MDKKRQFILSLDIIQKALVKNVPYTEKCRMIDQKSFELIKDKLPYKTIQSNQQINTIVKYGQRKSGINVYNRLLELFYVHITVDNYPELMKKILNYNCNDMVIYKFLRKLIKKRISRPNIDEFYKAQYNPILYEKCNHNLLHTQLIYYKIMKFIVTSEDYKPKNYLDIGCNDCIRTQMIGSSIGLKNDDIYGAVFKNIKSHEKMPINLVTIEDKLPFEDDKFSLISAFLVLHHMRDLDLMLREINRTLKMDGFFVYREFSCESNIEAMLIDINHAICQISYNNKKYQNQHFAQYYSNMEWTWILEQYGFKWHNSGWESTSILFNLSPTKIFYGIFQKVKEYDEIEGAPLNERYV